MNTLGEKEIKELKSKFNQDIHRKVTQTIKEKERVNLWPRRGEIWSVDLGKNVGSEIEGVRPCLVIQSDPFNKTSPLVMVYPINNPTKVYPNHVHLTSDLIKSSESGISGYVITEQPKSLSKGCFGRKIGELKEEIVDLCLEKQMFMCRNVKSTTHEELSNDRDILSDTIQNSPALPIKPDKKSTNKKNGKNKSKKSKKRKLKK